MDKNLLAIVCFVGILSLPCPTFYRQNEKEKKKKQASDRRNLPHLFILLRTTSEGNIRCYIYF